MPRICHVVLELTDQIPNTDHRSFCALNCCSMQYICAQECYFSNQIVFTLLFNEFPAVSELVGDANGALAWGGEDRERQDQIPSIPY